MRRDVLGKKKLHLDITDRLTSQLNLQRVIFPNSNLGFHPKLPLENLSPLL